MSIALVKSREEMQHDLQERISELVSCILNGTCEEYGISGQDLYLPNPRLLLECVKPSRRDEMSLFDLAHRCITGMYCAMLAHPEHMLTYYRLTGRVINSMLYAWHVTSEQYQSMTAELMTPVTTIDEMVTVYRTIVNRAAS